MKRILLILKEPFLDRIPSLKTLVMYLGRQGFQITILTSESKKFTVSTFDHKNIKYVKVREKTRKLEVPTTLKLLTRAFLYLSSHKVDYAIGGDARGNIIVHQLSKIFKFKHINFQLEYPQIITEKHPVLNRTEKWENNALRHADFVITHDNWHEQFLQERLKLNNKILLLPNASFTPEYKEQSSFLREKLRLSPNDVLILHSGGFGKWFRCKELAEATQNWNENYQLIFHTSHKVDDDPYFQSVYKGTYQHVVFSLQPVSTYELDSLVASANIGIALYSIEELGYRAIYMGLAAGKIGNYLKCGVPVIATRLPSLSYIEEYKCGVLIDNEDKIQEAITTILADIKSYKENAYRCYKELWYPEKYLSKIIQYL